MNHISQNIKNNIGKQFTIFNINISEEEEKIMVIRKLGKWYN